MQWSSMQWSSTQSSSTQSSRRLVRGRSATAFAVILLRHVLVTSQVSAQTLAFKDVTGVTGLKVSTDAACWVDLDNDGWVDVCVSGGVWKISRARSFCGLPTYRLRLLPILTTMDLSTFFPGQPGGCITMTVT